MLRFFYIDARVCRACFEAASRPRVLEAKATDKSASALTTDKAFNRDVHRLPGE